MNSDSPKEDPNIIITGGSVVKIDETTSPKHVMEVVLVEIRLLRKELYDFKEERRGAFKDHIKDCKHDMSEVFERLRQVEEHKARAETMNDAQHMRSLEQPHWAVAKATYWLVGMTALLVVEVLMNIYKFWNGAGH